MSEQQPVGIADLIAALDPPRPVSPFRVITTDTPVEVFGLRYSSMTELARAASVSVSVVSRALNDGTLETAIVNALIRKARA